MQTVRVPEGEDRAVRVSIKPGVTTARLPFPRRSEVLSMAFVVRVIVSPLSRSTVRKDSRIGRISGGQENGELITAARVITTGRRERIGVVET